jgi:glycosyltransferase involved in cell wall biosynthesis
VRRLAGSAEEALDDFGSPDILHDNGVWLPHNHRLAELAARRDIPRIVSTRGMLEPWALNHKHWKKKLAWCLYQQRDLERARCYHATADVECRSLRQLGLRAPVHIIPNGVDLPSDDYFVDRKRKVRSTESKTAFFLGRINPKKGLLLLVKAWNEVRPAGWQLKIAGPNEGGHRSEVEKAVVSLKLGDVVSFHGPLNEKMKTSEFSNADLFILPTYSENFGLVVVEALAHGVPVLTTTGTPWSMLPMKGCGWWVDPTPSAIVEGLHEATSQSQERLFAMGGRGREFVLTEFNWEAIAMQFVRVYDSMKAKVP